ncbi:HepT-like ribonuclease domain-containing protein [Leptolyngbya sp. AN03gr2]|uniref:HepT-like ribonuclease domain-containing protein n=1 Tax=unclassified Leptolyngbya TaxID=2650499 RepID=UPI003D316EF8
MPNPQLGLLDILNSAQLAIEFVAEMNQQEFEVDRKTQSAVLYQIAILGEAVKRLSPEFRSQHPDIPWSAMAGMRDKLIHDYEGVDVERVWLTLQSSIPALLQSITPLLPD